jgi:peptidyl-tRNA hydrolase
MGALELVKEHPIATGVGAVVIVGGVFVLTRGGGAPADPADPNAAASQAEVDAGLQLSAQQAQMQYASDQLGVQSATAIQLAQIQSAVQGQHDELAAGIASQQISAQQESADLSNTLQSTLAQRLGELSAQVSEAQITATRSIAENNNATATAIQASNNETLKAVTEIQAGQAVSLAETYASASVANTRAVAESNVGVAKANHSSCFITTVVCEVLGKPDDCAALVKLRRFRDEWLVEFSWGVALAANYSIIAPGIADKIREHPERDAICERLWEAFIAPAVAAIDRREHYRALTIYLELVNDCLLAFGCKR